MNSRGTIWCPRITILGLAFAVIFISGHEPMVRQELAVSSGFRLLTYNVDWAGARLDLITEVIRRSGAEIVCLQETRPLLEMRLRRELRDSYPLMEFRDSNTRTGGGCAFLSKVPAREVAFIPSETGWFAGWIMKFETAVGPVQVVNVHLRPAVGEDGRWSSVADYFTTSQSRVLEMKRFLSKREPDVPMLVAGDFNDGDGSPVGRWLENDHMTNSLPQFDRLTPTWRGQAGFVSLNLQLDHIFYSSELRCHSARVIKQGPSDHFPVAADFVRAGAFVLKQ